MGSQEAQTKKQMTHRTKKSLALLCIMIVVIIAAACYTIFIKPVQKKIDGKRNSAIWNYFSDL